VTAASNLRSVWDRVSRLDLAALLLALAGGLAYLLEVEGTIFNYLKFVALLAALYLLYRLLAWGRSRLLWSLRNRLIVAGLFIALVPVLLLALLAVRSAGILYSQLASYLLYEDVQRRKDMLTDIAEHIAAAHGTLPASVGEAEWERIVARQSHSVHDRELPGLTIEFSSDASLLRKIASNRQIFAGLLQQGESLSIISIRAIQESRGLRIATLRVPVTSDFLATIAPDLGAIQLNLMRRYSGGPRQGVLYTTDGGGQYETILRLPARNRSLQPALLWIDSPVDVVSRLDSTYVGTDGTVDPVHPVLAVFNARPSQLSSRMFSSLGELRNTYLIAFVLIVIAFFVIWAAALVTGLALTRQITKAIDELYRATQYVQAGDLSHRVRIERRDQLGVLGESFNLMTGSISGLIEEQKQRQRLENEISIAREVQDLCQGCLGSNSRPSAKPRALSVAITMTSFSSAPRTWPSPSPIFRGREFLPRS
jgi:sigma-B regulation protein RsbU (phosphoserine phosphatase)